MGTESNYKRTLAGSVGAGVGAIFSASGRTYYIIEHKTTTAYHNAGDSDKIIVDQIELGRDSSCQIRFDETCETVSRKHAAIVREGENWKIIPLSQTNATYVNSVPVQGEKMLNSGDEIRLSSHGPVMGFIVPQGAKSLVKSIGMTERMNLFRKQALAPYKKGLWAITILLIIIILGFVGYGVWSGQTITEQGKTIVAQGDKIDKQANLLTRQQKELEAQQNELDRTNEKAAEQKQYLEDLQRQYEEQEAIRKEAEEALAAANAEEKAALMKQIEAANKAAEDARKKANDATKKYIQFTKDAEKQNAAIKELENKISETKNVIEDAEPVAVVTEAAAPVVTEAQDVMFANIEECNPAVYYIKMDNVAIYDRSGKLIYQFDMSDFVGGTGFLLEDGRFVTARRVVEPWFYYWSTSIGEDNKGNIWTLGDLQACVNAGLKVEGNFTAYSPAQTSFKFSTSEMTKSAPKLKKYIETYKVSRYLRRIVDSSIGIYVYDTGSSAEDWATLGKRDQLNVVDGLKYSASASLSPKSGEDVIILGYPHSDGFSNSLTVNPEQRKNTINSPDLNDVNVIEMATKRFYKGADGAPVLQNIGGVWTVIGILGHTDGASDRDFAAPIANIK